MKYKHIFIFLIGLLIPCAALPQTNYGSFTIQKTFIVDSLEITSNYGIEGIAYGNGYLWGLTARGCLVKIDTVDGSHIQHLETVITDYGGWFYGAIAFNQDTIWVIDHDQLIPLDTLGQRQGDPIDFSALPDPYVGYEVSSIVVDTGGFWLMQPLNDVLFKIDRQGRLMKHYANSWFLKRTLTQFEDYLVVDNHGGIPPSNDDDFSMILGVDKQTGDMKGYWTYPNRHAYGYNNPNYNTHVGLTAGDGCFWSCEIFADPFPDEYFRIHKLDMPEPIPFPDFTNKKWGEFEIVDWRFCPVAGGAIEGIYGLGYDVATNRIWIGEGLENISEFLDTGGRYLNVTGYWQCFGWEHKIEYRDICTLQDSMWIVQYYYGMVAGKVSQVSLHSDGSFTVNTEWETGMFQSDGIATDGTNFWVSGREKSGITGLPSHIIKKFDPLGNELLRFEFPDSVDYHFGDLTWYEDALWAMASDLASDQAAIVEMNPETGEILRRYQTGWISLAAHVNANLASDGDHLIVINSVDTTDLSEWQDTFEDTHERMLFIKPKPPEIVAKPIANFSADTTYGMKSFTVQFTDSSVGLITSWHWDFGDGHMGEEQNPSHTYETSDTFTVSLTVTGPGGTDTKIRENYIIVFEPSNVSDLITSVPAEFRLYQNYPNPFNSSSKIQFTLQKSCFVTLKVLDLLGKEIQILVREKRAAGLHEVVWFAEGLPSGIYMYRLEIGGLVETKKLIIQK